MMRRLLLLALVACKSGGGESSVTTFRPAASTSTFAPDDEPAPGYGKTELQSALIAERGAEASAEHQLEELEASTDTDALRIAHDDLAVRRRYIATLEHCEAEARLCPPRLDNPAWTYSVESTEDPTLDTPLRFDLDSWQKIAAELNGRACACRTVACIDSIGVVIDRLEKRPVEDVQDDPTASKSIVRARECLFRLRGRHAIPRLGPPPA